MAYTKSHKSPYMKAFMPAPMLAELKSTSDRTGMSQQQLVRAALALYLDAANGRTTLHTVQIEPRSTLVAPPRPLPPPRPAAPA